MHLSNLTAIYFSTILSRLVFTYMTRTQECVYQVTVAHFQVNLHHTAALQKIFNITPS